MMSHARRAGRPRKLRPVRRCIVSVLVGGERGQNCLLSLDLLSRRAASHDRNAPACECGNAEITCLDFRRTFSMPLVASTVTAMLC